jgi:hypothetical protein
MALGIIFDEEREVAAYYDTVTGAAFGLVFTGYDGREQAEHFALWLSRNEDYSRRGDPRQFPYNALELLRSEWRKEYLDEDGTLTKLGHAEVATLP